MAGRNPRSGGRLSGADIREVYRNINSGMQYNGMQLPSNGPLSRNANDNVGDFNVSRGALSNNFVQQYGSLNSLNSARRQREQAMQQAQQSQDQYNWQRNQERERMAGQRADRGHGMEDTTLSLKAGNAERASVTEKGLHEASRIGEGMANLFGFNDLWKRNFHNDEGKFEVQPGVTPMDVAGTAGAFVAGLPFQILGAPMMGAEKLYEAAYGKDLQTMHDGLISKERLSDSQRQAAAVDGIIDTAGVALGGSGRALKGAGQLGKAFLGKEVGAAGKGVTEKLASGAAKSLPGQLAFEAAEEGGEEFVQGIAEQFRNNKDQTWQDIDWGQVAEGTALGAIGGVGMGAGGHAMGAMARQLNKDDAKRSQSKNSTVAQESSQVTWSDPADMRTRNTSDSVLPAVKEAHDLSDLKAPSMQTGMIVTCNGDRTGEMKLDEFDQSASVFLERAMEDEDAPRDIVANIVGDFEITQDPVTGKRVYKDANIDSQVSEFTDLVNKYAMANTLQERQDVIDAAAKLMNGWLAAREVAKKGRSRWWNRKDPSTDEGPIQMKLRRVTNTISKTATFHPAVGKALTMDYDGDKAFIYAPVDVLGKGKPEEFWSLLLSKQTGKEVFDSDFRYLPELDDDQIKNVVKQIYGSMSKLDGVNLNPNPGASQYRDAITQHMREMFNNKDTWSKGISGLVASLTQLLEESGDDDWNYNRAQSRAASIVSNLQRDFQIISDLKPDTQSAFNAQKIKTLDEQISDLYKNVSTLSDSEFRDDPSDLEVFREEILRDIVRLSYTFQGVISPIEISSDNPNYRADTARVLRGLTALRNAMFQYAENSGQSYSNVEWYTDIVRMANGYMDGVANTDVLNTAFAERVLTDSGTNRPAHSKAEFDAMLENFARVHDANVDEYNKAIARLNAHGDTFTVAGAENKMKIGDIGNHENRQRAINEWLRVAGHRTLAETYGITKNTEFGRQFADLTLTEYYSELVAENHPDINQHAPEPWINAQIRETVLAYNSELARLHLQVESKMIPELVKTCKMLATQSNDIDSMYASVALMFNGVAYMIGGETIDNAGITDAEDFMSSLWMDIFQNPTDISETDIKRLIVSYAAIGKYNPIYGYMLKAKSAANQEEANRWLDLAQENVQKYARESHIDEVLCAEAMGKITAMRADYQGDVDLEEGLIWTLADTTVDYETKLELFESLTPFAKDKGKLLGWAIREHGQGYSTSREMKRINSAKRCWAQAQKGSREVLNADIESANNEWNSVLRHTGETKYSVLQRAHRYNPMTINADIMVNAALSCLVNIDNALKEKAQNLLSQQAFFQQVSLMRLYGMMSFSDALAESMFDIVDMSTLYGNPAILAELFYDPSLSIVLYDDMPGGKGGQITVNRDVIFERAGVTTAIDPKTGPTDAQFDELLKLQPELSRILMPQTVEANLIGGETASRVGPSYNSYKDYVSWLADNPEAWGHQINPERERKRFENMVRNQILGDGDIVAYIVGSMGDFEVRNERDVQRFRQRFFRELDAHVESITDGALHKLADGESQDYRGGDPKLTQYWNSWRNSLHAQQNISFMDSLADIYDEINAIAHRDRDNYAGTYNDMLPIMARGLGDFASDATWINYAINHKQEIIPALREAKRAAKSANDKKAAASLKQLIDFLNKHTGTVGKDPESALEIAARFYARTTKEDVRSEKLRQLQESTEQHVAQMTEFLKDIATVCELMQYSTARDYITEIPWHQVHSGYTNSQIPAVTAFNKYYGQANDVTSDIINEYMMATTESVSDIPFSDMIFGNHPFFHKFGTDLSFVERDHVPVIPDINAATISVAEFSRLKNNLRDVRAGGSRGERASAFAALRAKSDEINDTINKAFTAIKDNNGKILHYEWVPGGYNSVQAVYSEHVAVYMGMITREYTKRTGIVKNIAAERDYRRWGEDMEKAALEAADLIASDLKERGETQMNTGLKNEITGEGAKPRAPRPPQFFDAAIAAKVSNLYVQAAGAEVSTMVGINGTMQQMTTALSLLGRFRTGSMEGDIGAVAADLQALQSLAVSNDKKNFRWRDPKSGAVNRNLIGDLVLIRADVLKSSDPSVQFSLTKAHIPQGAKFWDSVPDNETREDGRPGFISYGDNDTQRYYAFTLTEQLLEDITTSASPLVDVLANDDSAMMVWDPINILGTFNGVFDMGAMNQSALANAMSEDGHENWNALRWNMYYLVNTTMEALELKLRKKFPGTSRYDHRVRGVWSEDDNALYTRALFNRTIDIGSVRDNFRKCKKKLRKSLEDALSADHVSTSLSWHNGNFAVLSNFMASRIKVTYENADGVSHDMYIDSTALASDQAFDAELQRHAVTRDNVKRIEMAPVSPRQFCSNMNRNLNKKLIEVMNQYEHGDVYPGSAGGPELTMEYLEEVANDCVGDWSSYDTEQDNVLDLKEVFNRMPVPRPAHAGNMAVELQPSPMQRWLNTFKDPRVSGATSRSAQLDTQNILTDRSREGSISRREEIVDNYYNKIVLSKKPNPDAGSARTGYYFSQYHVTYGTAELVHDRSNPRGSGNKGHAYDIAFRIIKNNNFHLHHGPVVRDVVDDNGLKSPRMALMLSAHWDAQRQPDVDLMRKDMLDAEACGQTLLIPTEIWDAMGKEDFPAGWGKPVPEASSDFGRYPAHKFGEDYVMFNPSDYMRSQSFIRDGGLRTLMKTYRDAQITACMEKDTYHGDSVVWLRRSLADDAVWEAACNPVYEKGVLFSNIKHEGRVMEEVTSDEDLEIFESLLEEYMNGDETNNASARLHFEAYKDNNNLAKAKDPKTSIVPYVRAHLARMKNADTRDTTEYSGKSCVSIVKIPSTMGWHYAPIIITDETAEINIRSKAIRGDKLSIVYDGRHKIANGDVNAICKVLPDGWPYKGVATFVDDKECPLFWVNGEKVRADGMIDGFATRKRMAGNKLPYIMQNMHYYSRKVGYSIFWKRDAKTNNWVPRDDVLNDGIDAQSMRKLQDGDPETWYRLMLANALWSDSMDQRTQRAMNGLVRILHSNADANVFKAVFNMVDVHNGKGHLKHSDFTWETVYKYAFDLDEFLRIMHTFDNTFCPEGMSGDQDMNTEVSDEYVFDYAGRMLFEVYEDDRESWTGRKEKKRGKHQPFVNGEPKKVRRDVVIAPFNMTDPLPNETVGLTVQHSRQEITGWNQRNRLKNPDHIEFLLAAIAHMAGNEAPLRQWEEMRGLRYVNGDPDTDTKTLLPGEALWDQGYISYLLSANNAPERVMSMSMRLFNERMRQVSRSINNAPKPLVQESNGTEHVVSDEDLLRYRNELVTALGLSPAERSTVTVDDAMSFFFVFHFGWSADDKYAGEFALYQKEFEQYWNQMINEIKSNRKRGRAPLDGRKVIRGKYTRYKVPLLTSFWNKKLAASGWANGNVDELVELELNQLDAAARDVARAGEADRETSLLDLMDYMLMDNQQYDRVKPQRIFQGQTMEIRMSNATRLDSKMFSGEDLDAYASDEERRAEFVNAMADYIRDNDLEITEDEDQLGGLSARRSGANKSRVARILRNIIAMRRMMGLLNPYLYASSAIDKACRQGFASVEADMIISGQIPALSQVYTGESTIPVSDHFDDILAAAGRDEDGLLMFNTLKKAQWSGDEMEIFAQAKSSEDLRRMVNESVEKQSTMERAFGKVAGMASAESAFNKNHFRLFVKKFIINAMYEGQTYWFAKEPGSDETLLEISLKNPAGFLAEIFSNTSTSFELAMRTLNQVRSTDMGQKNLVTLFLNGICRNHPFFDLFTATTFSPYMQYRTNQMGRIMNWIAPMSSLHYLAQQYMKDPNHGKWIKKQAGLDGEGVADAMISTIQMHNSMKQAIISDIMHMSLPLLAMSLVGLAAFEPPEDERLWAIPSEWTIFGLRVTDKWWIEDTIGLAIPYAAFWKSIILGRPCPEVLYNGVAQFAYTNPIVGIGDLTNMVFDPEAALEQQYGDLSKFENAPDGKPTFWDLTTVGTLGTWGTNQVLACITPGIIKEIYRALPEHERTAYWVEDPEADFGRSKVSWLDSQVRKLAKVNPVAALVANIASGQGVDGNYWNVNMPESQINEPVQMASYEENRITDDEGNLKNNYEEIVGSVISTLIAYHGKEEELWRTGFYIPSETKDYIGKMLHDQRQNLWNEYYQYDASGAFNYYALGDGDYDIGKAIKQEIRDAYQHQSDMIDEIYDSLYSKWMRQSMVTYYRYNTTYLKDGDGNWYATGIHRDIRSLIPVPIDVAPGSVYDPEQPITTGQEYSWTSPSFLNGRPMFDNDNAVAMRALMPESEMDPYVPMDAWDDDNTSYGAQYPAYAYGYGTGSSGFTKGYRGKYKRSYKGGGGGGGYSRSYGGGIYASHASSPYVRDTNYTVRESNPYSTNYDVLRNQRVYMDFDYIRPNFETKGSRKAYRREDF